MLPHFLYSRLLRLWLLRKIFRDNLLCLEVQTRTSTVYIADISHENTKKVMNWTEKFWYLRSSFQGNPFSCITPPTLFVVVFCIYYLDLQESGEGVIHNAAITSTYFRKDHNYCLEKNSSFVSFSYFLLPTNSHKLQLWM